MMLLSVLVRDIATSGSLSGTLCLPLIVLVLLLSVIYLIVVVVLLVTATLKLCRETTLFELLFVHSRVKVALHLSLKRLHHRAFVLLLLPH